jgi:hypothetical protein
MYGTRLGQEISINFDTVTDVYYIKSRLQTVSPILESMSCNITNLASVAADLELLESPCHRCTTASSQVSQWISNAKDKCATLRRSAAYLHDQTNSTIEILSKRLEFEDKDEVQKQSGYLLQLTKSAVDDSVAVRVITFITLIYLSCTVVGVSKATLK